MGSLSLFSAVDDEGKDRNQDEDKGCDADEEEGLDLLPGNFYDDIVVCRFEVLVFLAYGYMIGGFREVFDHFFKIIAVNGGIFRDISVGIFLMFLSIRNLVWVVLAVNGEFGTA